MLFFFAALTIAAVFSTKLSTRLGIPVLIAFLGIGLVAGSDVLNLFYFDDAALTKKIADVLLIFILFGGGFQTKKAALREVAGPALTLATAGVVLTAALLGGIIHGVTGLPLAQALMVAAMISSTDAAAVMMTTRANPIRPRVAATLEIESAANDPAAILLTVALVEIVAGRGGSVPGMALDLLWQLGGGVLVGLVLSVGAQWLFEHLESENRGYYDVLAIGVVLLIYGAADLIHANGIIAVFFGGYGLGNADFPGKRGIGNFLESVMAFCNIALFLMLGLLAFPKNFLLVWKEGLGIAVLLIFVARPLVVLLCTAPFAYSLRERLFVMWGGIKGAVPIVLATYPATAGIDPQGTAFNIIFFAVLVSCLAQGTTMGPLARVLGLAGPPRLRSPHSLELHSTRKSPIDMFELKIDAGSWAVGRRIIDLRLPQDVLVSSLIRQGHIIPPKGTTEIRADDILFVLGPAVQAESMATGLNAPAPPSEGPPA